MPDGRLDLTRLAAARLRAADAQPFLALALYALNAVAVPGHGTFSVDADWRLYIDPERLATWSIDEVAGVLLHEVGHVIRDHAGRARSAGVSPTTHLAWNLAADAEINEPLAKLRGVALPGGGVTPARLGQPDGYLCEWYYSRLLRDGIPEDLPPVRCGSGCDGLDDAPIADGLPAPLRPVEALLLRRRVAHAVLLYRQTHPGTVPGGWERWAEATLRPTLNWRQLLDASIRGAVANVTGSADYSYSRPARRQVPHVVLPAMVRPLPTVAVVVDTSASMDEQLLGRAWSEVAGCLRHLGVCRERLTVYAADTVARRVVAPLGQRALLQGGGGTDMGRGIEAALAARATPDLVVVLTDGFTPWPPTPPRRPVVVGLLTTGLDAPRPPPGATTIRIPADAA
ncbi:MAG: hypothetical protein QOJ23_1155 [Actinomycetota bacterium]|jgi:predicted metal-dependent peptidase|nr:hypothetical protein [Actinomycetota bacterium]